ncbi:transcription elongation factor GreA [bacterium]|nr:transcription elongation factor GreA [bacterium]
MAKATRPLVILTEETFKRLKERLRYLEEEERKKIAEEIKEARAFGDISENAEFEEARHRQALLEQEIAELKAILASAKIVRKKGGASTITIGSKVKLKTGNQILEYEIVGDREANPSEGKISYRSPWGQALMGKTKGEVVEIQTPSGKKQLQILEVK